MCQNTKHNKTAGAPSSWEKQSKEMLDQVAKSTGFTICDLSKCFTVLSPEISFRCLIHCCRHRLENLYCQRKKNVNICIIPLHTCCLTEQHRSTGVQDEQKRSGNRQNTGPLPINISGVYFSTRWTPVPVL